MTYAVQFTAGLPTKVGSTYSNLTVGSPSIANADITLDGDGNQEYIDNLSALDWNNTLPPCYHFELNEIKGVQHDMLPLDPDVIGAISQIIFTDPPAFQC